MCTREEIAKWITLSGPSIDCIIIPTGMDTNNYLVIDRDFWCSKINCIYKYDIDNDKWIKIHGFNNIDNIMSQFSAALDVKKQILFLSQNDCVTQIQLNDNNIRNDNHNNTTSNPKYSKSIIVNNSLFIIGGSNYNSILKWDSKKK
eukprot:232258_1